MVFSDSQKRLCFKQNIYPLLFFRITRLLHGAVTASKNPGLHSIFACDFAKIKDDVQAQIIKSIESCGFREQEIVKVENRIFLFVNLQENLESLYFSFISLKQAAFADPDQLKISRIYRLPDQVSDFYDEISDWSSRTEPTLKFAVPTDADRFSLSSADTEKLKSLDIASIIREQPLYRFNSKGEISEIASELFLNFIDIQHILGLRQLSPLLREQVTLLLDSKMLRHVTRDRSKRRYYSLNMHLDGVLSEQFDTEIETSNIRSLIIELPYNEIFDNPQGFQRAAEKLESFKITLGIDHVPAGVLPFLFTSLKHVSFIKVKLADMESSSLDRRRILRRKDDASQLPIVVNQCSTMEDYGNFVADGLSHFQGWGFNEFIRANEKKITHRKPTNFSVNKNHLSSENIFQNQYSYRSEPTVQSGKDSPKSQSPLVFREEKILLQKQREEKIIAKYEDVLKNGGARAWLLKWILEN